MYLAVFLCGAGHLKHFEICSQSQTNKEQACSAYGKVMLTYINSLLVLHKLLLVCFVKIII